MKYLITESQMKSFLNDYLKMVNPELFDLSKFPMRRNDKNKTIYGYEFEMGDTLILVFEYFIMPESKNEVCASCPKLRVTRKLRNEVEGMFGPQGIDLLAEWFEDTYKLPVKTYFV
jgi:hypothetical protein